MLNGCPLSQTDLLHKENYFVGIDAQKGETLVCLLTTESQIVQIFTHCVLCLPLFGT